MSLSDADLQKYVGQNVRDVEKELEKQGKTIADLLIEMCLNCFVQGYKVHLVRTGSFATGFVPARAVVLGEEGAKPEKHVSLSFNGDDPDQKVTSIQDRSH